MKSQPVVLGEVRGPLRSRGTEGKPHNIQWAVFGPNGWVYFITERGWTDSARKFRAADDYGQLLLAERTQ